jgi:photosystem II stability/assembly factor-like uncharacterized protein
VAGGNLLIMPNKKQLFFLFFFLLYPTFGRCQWRLLTPNLLGPYVNGVITYTDGYIFASPGSGNSLWVSSDTGKTWTQRNVITPITTIDFVDPEKGLIIAGSSAFYTLDQGLTWIPLGNDFSPPTQFSGGTFDKSGNIIILNGSYFDRANNPHLNIYRTSDMGLTWDTIPRAIDRLETPIRSKSGKIYDVGSISGTIHGVNISSDGGKTWKSPVGNFPSDSWSIAGDKCDDNIIYVANEAYLPLLISRIFVSLDDGLSFQPTISRPSPFFAGSVAATRNAVYCPTVTDSGVFRSTDHGQTWKSIGGPPSPHDTRQICAINDNIIIVGDTAGNIWITENSGGDPVVDHSLQADQYIYPTIASCDTASAAIIVVNTCDSVVVTKANFISLDAQSFVLTGPNFPDTLTGGATLQFTLHFDPHHVAKNFTGQLDIEGITLDWEVHTSTYLHISVSAETIAEHPVLSLSDTGIDFGLISTCNRDTIITLKNNGCDTLSIVSGPGLLPQEFVLLSSIQFPLSLSPDSIVKLQFRFHPLSKGNFNAAPLFTASEHGFTKNFSFSLRGINNRNELPLSVSTSDIILDTTSICAPPVDTTVTFINKGCDTLAITQGPGALAPEFTLVTSFNLPIKIPPDSSFTITFQFKPSGTGRFISRPHFVAEQQGLQQSIDLYLDGTGKSEGGLLVFSPKQFNFQSLSICSHDSATGFVTNTGCDSIGLDPAQIFGAKDYNFTANSLRLSVKPKDTVNYKVYLNPAQKGLRSGYLVFNSDIRRDTIPFTATVTDGTKILSSSVQSVDFGTVSVCDNRDTIIRLSNSGCDTIHISGISGLVSGFGTTAKFPITILPGTDTSIDIFTVLDTVGGKTASSATFTVSSDDDSAVSPIHPINLMRTYAVSARRDVGLFLDPTPKSGGDLSSVSYDIKETAGKTFTGAGIQQISFDLNYNTNLLTFDLAKSSNLTGNGTTFTIIGSPEIRSDTNGVLASVGFIIYLTKDSVTPITMTTRTDTTRSSCGIMTMGVGGSATFDYNFLCGERSISGFMNGVLPLKIISLYPNPAQDIIELDVRSTQNQNATVRIFDALGIKYFSNGINMVTGLNTIFVPTQSLSNGAYLLLINSTDASASQNFLKVK